MPLSCVIFIRIVNGDDNSKLSVGKHHLSGTIPRRLKDQRSDADIRRLQVNALSGYHSRVNLKCHSAESIAISRRMMN
ncbi:Receptor-like protein [Dirofilaria immitis]